MPAVSRDQRIAMAIAEHHPEDLNSANKGLLSMSKEQLHDFAATPEKGLPKHVPGSRYARYKSSRGGS